MKHIMKAALLSVAIAIGSTPLSSCGEPPLTPVDPFEKLEVTFSGISGYTGTFEINKPIYDGSKYISYTSAQKDTVLSNGDTVTMTVTADNAALKELGLEVTATSKDYAVTGLPEIPEDLTEAEIEQLASSILPLDKFDFQVGEKIDIKADMSGCDFDDDLWASMSSGEWKIDQITPWNKEKCCYCVWSDPGKLYYQEIINSFSALYRKDITIKCTGLNDSGQMFADYNEQHPEEPMDVQLPSQDDTLTFTLYCGNRTGYSGIYRTNNELSYPEKIDSGTISTNIEEVIEHLNYSIPDNAETLTEKEY